MPRILVFRPSYDLASSYLHAWLDRVISYACQKGYGVTDLSGPGATLDNFRLAMAENPDLVVIGTHGNEREVAGDLSSPFIRSCDNDGMLSGKMVVYGACLAGQVLAKTTHEKGAPLVIGYQHEYVWPFDPLAPSPAEDRVAAPFGDLYAEPILALLDGLGPKEIYSRTMRKYDEVYAGLSRSPELDAAFSATALLNNRDGLVVYGEGGTLAAAAPRWPVYALLAAAAIAVGWEVCGRVLRRARP
jgi:hypothetical protein